MGISGATQATQQEALIGIGLQTFGALNSAQAARNKAANDQAMANYQSQVAENNAQLAGYQAQQEELIGQTQEQNVRLRGAQTYGAQRASLAANGVDLGEGSANEILASTAYLNERDALTTRDNALRRAWGYKVQAQNLTSSSRAYSAAADSISPDMAGATSLLGGAAGVADSWYRYQKAFGKGDQA